MDYLKAYEFWANDKFFDEDTRLELSKIAQDDKEIKERFHKELEFGTGGLRGIIGAGTNRINIYTVRKATQGFANYLKKQDFGGKNLADMGICIAYDPRNMSYEFALETALVMCANGIKAYIFESLRPTPELSFAVRELGCAGGVVITASHNPPEYNGYKVYGQDGGQVPFPKDEEIICEVNKVTDFSSIPVSDKNEAKEKGLYIEIGSDADNKYYNAVLNQIIDEKALKSNASGLKIVYTPLNGTGNIPVKEVLKRAGFNNVFAVPEQENPDGNFTTVGYPNPEDPAVFKLAVKLADSVDADIIIGTDPDADRVGIVVKNQDGEFKAFTGNMTGALLADYILSRRKAQNKLPADGTVISTIVSSRLTKAIAESYNVKYAEVLTGFKYIGEKIKEMEISGSGSFIFGFEESYGYLPGTYARDKDAVAATLLICEMAAYYKSRNMSLVDGLMEVYGKYGYYKEKVESITLKGIEGSENMKKIMEALKGNPPASINGKKVLKALDYSNSTEKDMETGEVSAIDLPKSNVLYYITEDESWICVRPSGTEPKIKIYFGVKGRSEAEAEELLSGVISDTMRIVKAAE